MLSQNARAYNLLTEVRNVLYAFEEMRKMINVNNGTRSISFRNFDCHDQSALFHYYCIQKYL